MEDCSVCCETTKCTKCPYCSFVACPGCVSTFLLGLSRDSHCMNCSKLWNREVLLDVIGKQFVNGKHKWHRENLLFEREKSLFPQTQSLIVRENRARKLEKIKHEIIKKFVIEHGHKPGRYNPVFAEYNQVMETLGLIDRGSQAKPVRKQFVRKCPGDGCQGFLSTQWKCGLCSKHICKDCNEEKLEDHECDPGNVETVKLLAKDTKPCPKCGELIFKASGCSQMWCTACHCTFDWNTMQIETGNIHNPHYYEYQRMNGTLQRNPGDVPCGDVNRFPSAYDVRIAVYRGEYGLTYLEYVDKFLRLGIEMEAFLPRNRVEDSNLENRKSFMRGKISEYQFKFRIQKNEKHREKKRDIRNIHDMFVNVSKDLFAQLVNQTVGTREFIEMAKNLVVYTNESLRKTKVLYDNCVMEFIDVEKLEMVSDSKKRKPVVPV